jgi:hypothetical protein
MQSLISFCDHTLDEDKRLTGTDTKCNDTLLAAMFIVYSTLNIPSTTPSLLLMRITAGTYAPRERRKRTPNAVQRVWIEVMR